MQRFLKQFGYYSGSIDGVAGTGTKKALQTYLRGSGYTGPIDCIFGKGTYRAWGLNISGWVN